MSFESRAHGASSPLPLPLLAALATALLAACAAPVASPPGQPPAAPLPVAQPGPPQPAPSAPSPPPEPAPEPPTPVEPAPEPVVTTPVQGALPGGIRTDSSATTVALLGFAERVRRLPPPELAQEVQRLTDKPEATRLPADDMQLAMALAHTRSSADLVRAQAVLQRLMANPREDARGLHPLAGLLATRYAEQRRLEEQVERQAQQLREQQRRIDQLNERLEAVRAVERSLAPRPVSPANGSPARPPAAP